MSTNAPHGTTSKYSTFGTESIERITMVKLSISNHVILVIVIGVMRTILVIGLGKSFNEFVEIIAIRLGKSFNLLIAIRLGKTLYECVATLKPFPIPSKLTVIIVVLVCWK